MRVFTILFSLFILRITFLSGQSLFVQVGIATYYHDKFEGRKTSSGERYYKTKFTAAHPTLPMGTYLKVTNVANNKTTIVKVNDRCAVRKTRIIDLSKKAAQEIGVLQKGIAKVKIEKIDTTIKSNDKFFIRVATLRSNEGAKKTIKSFSSTHQSLSNIVVAQRGKDKYYKIYIGPYKNEEEAENNLKLFIKKFKNSYIIRTDNTEVKI